MEIDETEWRWLKTRQSMTEDAIGHLLALAGVPVDMISAWRGWTHHPTDSTTYLHMTMNNISAHLGRPSWQKTGQETRRVGSATFTSMCGRARLSTDIREIRIQFKLAADTLSVNLRPTWNLAPTQDMLVVGHRPGVGRAARLMKWGLIPSWSDEPKARGATFNARSEEMRAKPTYRNAWKSKRRCLLVIDGYYEWRQSDKVPFAIALASKKPMAVGGLWERWHREGQEEVYSCTAITQAAGPSMNMLHDREPLILPEADWPVWLGEVEGDVEALIRPYGGGDLIHWPVSKMVGNVKNNGPELIETLTR